MSTAILQPDSSPATALPATAPVEQITDSVIAPADANTPLEQLAVRWVVLESRAVKCTLARGDLLYRYLGRCLAGRTGADRREARARLIIEVIARLGEQGFDCNVTRLLGLRAVADAFGRDEALERSASALAELVPLLRRIRDSEEWEVRAAYRADADRLWRRIVTSHLGAPAIRAAVAGIRGRPATTRPATTSRRPTAAAFAARATEADLAELIEVLPDDLLDYLSGLLAAHTDVLPEVPAPSTAGLFRRLSG